MLGPVDNCPERPYIHPDLVPPIRVSDIRFFLAERALFLDRNGLSYNDLLIGNMVISATRVVLAGQNRVYLRK